MWPLAPQKPKAEVIAHEAGQSHHGDGQVTPPARPELRKLQVWPGVPASVAPGPGGRAEGGVGDT